MQYLQQSIQYNHDLDEVRAIILHVVEELDIEETQRMVDDLMYVCILSTNLIHRGLVLTTS